MNNIEFEFLNESNQKPVEINLQLALNSNCESKLWSTSADPKESPKFEDGSLLVKECGYDVNVKEVTNQKYFTLDNLFSELITEYQKHVARLNLGIAEEYSLIWGNLSGNLLNLEDLINFVTEHIQELSLALHLEYDTKFDDIISYINNGGFNIKIYYGPSISELNLSSSLTFTTGEYDSYIYILTPNENTEFYVNGILGGFVLQSNTTIIDNTKYFIYKSFNSNLGATKITLKYGESS